MSAAAEKIKEQSLHPYPQKNRPGFSVMWVDPRSGDRRNSSLATHDETEAKQICVHLEIILKTPSIWDATATDARLFEFHPRAVEIFFGFKPEDVKNVLEVTIEKPKSSLARALHMAKHGGSRTITIPMKEFDDERKARILAERAAGKEKTRRQELEKENARLSRKLNLHCKATLGEAVTKYKVHYSVGHAQITVNHSFSILDHFVEFVGEKKLLGELTHTQIDDWLAEYKNRRRRKAEPDGKKETKEDTANQSEDDEDVDADAVSPVTKAKNKRYLSTFFSWAFRKYDLAENPIEKTLPIAGVDRNPENIIAIRNYDQLIDFLDALEKWPYWRAWAAVACLAGPRWAEQCWLKKSDVYLDNGYLRITTRTGGRAPTGTKTGRERNVPIEQKQLKTILEDHLKTLKASDHWLFPGPADLKTTNGRWRENAQFLTIWRRVAAEAQEKAKSTADYWTYGPAEWRHTAATAMGHSDVSAGRISQWIGNSEDVCRRHYIAPLSGKKWPLSWGS